MNRNRYWNRMTPLEKLSRTVDVLVLMSITLICVWGVYFVLWTIFS